MNLKSVCKPRGVVSRAGPRVTRIVSGTAFLLIASFVVRSAADIYTLPPGGNITAVSSGFPTGGSVLDTTSVGFTTATLDGTVTSTVYSGDPSNPYGGLTFTYSLSLLNTSSDSASELTAGSFGGFLTDVSYNLSGSELAPSNFSRSSGTGANLQFFFSNGGGIAPGQTGALIVVQTDAQGFQLGAGGVIDSVPGNVNLFVPLPVPEPATGSLLATGLATFFVFRRRTSK